MFTILKAYGLSDWFVDRINNMYDNASSSIQINGTDCRHTPNPVVYSTRVSTEHGLLRCMRKPPAAPTRHTPGGRPPGTKRTSHGGGSVRRWRHDFRDAPCGFPRHTRCRTPLRTSLRSTTKCPEIQVHSLGGWNNTENDLGVDLSPIYGNWASPSPTQ